MAVVDVAVVVVGLVVRVAHVMDVGGTGDRVGTIAMESGETVAVESGVLGAVLV